MKKLFLTLGMAAYTAAGHAQDCNGYLYMTNNAEVQMTIYDKKGKESGVQTWKISDVKKDGAGFQSTINSSFKDDKGKEIAKEWFVPGVGIVKSETYKNGKLAGSTMITSFKKL